jgi:hypothetical protein
MVGVLQTELQPFWTFCSSSPAVSTSEVYATFVGFCINMHSLATIAVALDWLQVRSRGIVVDEVALGQVFSKYFTFPCQFSFQLLHVHSKSYYGHY